VHLYQKGAKDISRWTVAPSYPSASATDG